MVDIVTRQSQLTQLTHSRVDQNFINLAEAIDTNAADVAQFGEDGGSALIGNGGESVRDSLNALQLADYAALRLYVGPRKGVYITGYLATSAPSGIAGNFVRDDHDNATLDDNATCIVTIAGVRFKRVCDYVTPEMWLAKGDGNSDDTAPLQSAAAYLKARGAGVLVLRPGATYYAQLPVGGVYPGGKLLDLGYMSSITIEGNGARILTGPATLTQMAICLDGASEVRVSNLRMESQYQVLASNAGIDWIVAGDGAHDLVFENIDLTWGVGGIVPRGPAVGSGTDANRTRNIVVRNLTTSGTYYPLHPQGAGDNLVANIRTRNAGRSFFTYNSRNQDVMIDSAHGGPFSDVLIKCYGSTSWDSRTENIKVRYSTRGRSPGSGNQSSNEALVAMDFQLSGTNPAPCQIQDIDVLFDVEASSADKMRSMFIVRKYDSTGAADTTASRGHGLINLKLSGTGRSLQNLLSDAIRLFTRSPDNWTGEYVAGVWVDGMSLGMTSGQVGVAFDGTAVKESSGVRNVYTSGNLIAPNTAGKSFMVESSTFGNAKYSHAPTAYAPAWTAVTTNPSIGSGTIAGEHFESCGVCHVTARVAMGSTTTFGSGNWSIGLPFPAANIVERTGSGRALDSGTQFYQASSSIQPGASTMEMLVGGTAGNMANATTPFTWASGDYFVITASYPIAYPTA